ncbi:MAG: tyrosine-type recombinase/integrase, partial [Thermoplasmatales archaeon]
VTKRFYSPRTIKDFKHAIKMFYKWMGKNDVVSWISLSNGKERRESEDLITEEEVEKLVKNAKNSRDRALIYLLYDSGCRIGELLNLKNKDVPPPDDYGLIISVFGKTGSRKVRVIGNSVAYVREWQNSHPDKNNPNAWFFCGIADNIRGRQLTHADVYKMLKQTKVRAGIERRIHPHLFRHTRATLLASRVTEAPLEAQMGWVHGSKMSQTYVHLSMRDQDRAILKAYGIELKEERNIETEQPIKCPRCGEPNDKVNRFCWKCGMILDKTLTERKLMEEAKEIESSLLKSQVVDNSTKKIIQEFPPEFKDLILETVLKQIVESPELKERFQREIAERTQSE